MAWCQPGNKPLLEAILIQFIDTYMQHKGEMSWAAYIEQDKF